MKHLKFLSVVRPFVLKYMVHHLCGYPAALSTNPKCPLVEIKIHFLLLIFWIISLILFLWIFYLKICLIVPNRWLAFENKLSVSLPKTKYKYELNLTGLTQACPFICYLFHIRPVIFSLFLFFLWNLHISFIQSLTVNIKIKLIYSYKCNK